MELSPPRRPACLARKAVSSPALPQCLGRTFTSVPSTTHFDNEGPAAAEVAALYPNMRHVLVESSATSFLDILDHNNNLYDHPCFGPSNEVWSNAIMAQARENGITAAAQRKLRQFDAEL